MSTQLPWEAPLFDHSGPDLDWAGFQGRRKVWKSEGAIKGSFYSESAIRFSNLQKKYSKLLFWTWNLNLLFTVIGGKFKLQVQDSDLDFFLEIWDLKTHRTFWKKATFSNCEEM